MTTSKAKYLNSAKAQPQSWFLLSEEVSSSGRYLEKRNLIMMEACELSFENFKEILNFGPTEHVEFWLTSDSLHPTEKVVSDRELFLSYQMFCKDDPVVTVVARRKNDSTSSSSSQFNALELFVERLQLWGHVWNVSGITPPERATHLKQIAFAHPYFHNNARLFVQDLVFSTASWSTREEKDLSRIRLASVHRPFYLGRPYFSDEVAACILNTPIEEYTLAAVLAVLSRQARYTGQLHWQPEIRNLVLLFLYVFGWTLDCVPDEKLELMKVPEPQRKRKETRGIVDTSRKKFSGLIKRSHMPKAVPKVQPKGKIWNTKDIKGKSRVTSIVPEENCY